MTKPLTEQDSSLERHPWNLGATSGLRRIEVEDRLSEYLSPSAGPVDALNAALRLDSDLGVSFAHFGELNSSEGFLHKIRSALNFIVQKELSITPILALNPETLSLEPAFTIFEDQSLRPVIEIPIFPTKDVSALSTLDSSIEAALEVCELLHRDAQEFRINFLHAAGISPAALVKAFSLLSEYAPSSVVLSDLSHSCNPSGVASITRFVRDLINGINPSIALVWHGSPVSGFNLANNISAACSGADTISGTFSDCPTKKSDGDLGQLLWLAKDAGSARFNMAPLAARCEAYGAASPYLRTNLSSSA